MDRGKRQLRSAQAKFETREQDNDLYISGYFAVFNSNYEIWKGMSESIDPHAFDDQLNEDIRALIDHKTRLVIGRTKAGTLQLRVDDTGLWGDVKINRNDVDAMNVYERVKRGDVDQCSIGFEIVDEDVSSIDNKTHWTIKKVKLYEVSIVTFPAYEETCVSARKRQLEDMTKRSFEAWKMNTIKKLKGESCWH